MLHRNETGILVLFTLSLCLVAGLAQAQANPELGEVGGSAQVGASTDTGTTAQAQGTTWQPPTNNQVAAANDTDTAAANTADTEATGDSDHAGVVGTFGVGFFGTLDIPAMGCAAGPGCTDTAFGVTAPTLGVRYWMAHNMGIEAALGFNISSSGTTTTPPAGAATDTNGPSYVGFGLHGGLPLVFADTGHFAFELVPELNFGIATGSLDDTSAANADVDLSGLLFELGARVGAEIHFGFIDIPQLALQGTVGAHLRVESRSSTLNTAGGATEFSASSFRFGTDLQGEPWDIFTGAISAIYYF